ncbi:MAG: hypothetical protein ACOX0A_04290 [Thermoguttaceae bacterium]|jgi:hypothetical protein
MTYESRLRRNIRSFAFGVALFLCCALSSFGADAFRWNLGDSTLALSTEGRAQLFDNDGSPVVAASPAFQLTTVEGRKCLPIKVVPQRNGGDDFFEVSFDNGAVATYRVLTTEGSVVLRLLDLQSEDEIDECVVFMLSAPSEETLSGWIVKSRLPDGRSVGLFTTSVNVIPAYSIQNARKGDREDCSHTFKALSRADADDPDSDDETNVAEFCAASDRSGNDGWSYRGRYFDNPLDFSGCLRLRARVYGDGKGESLKIQLGGKTGHRDDYISIDFTGWKVCELDSPALNDLSYDDVRFLYLYYNGLPGKTSVRTLVDWIDVVFEDGNGNERVMRLEDFSDVSSPFWDSSKGAMTAKSFSRHHIYPASCGIVLASDEDWNGAVARMQRLADVPSPRLGGENGWRGDSPYIHQSYFFLTNFKVDEYETALKIAKRGGFKQILLLQNSWCKSTGHYEVNDRSFPGGLPTLLETIQNFNKEGIRFGLHLLAASVDRNDPYLTPVPDERFVTDVESTLAEGLSDDANDKTIKTTDDATIFPVGEDPYMGSGQVVRIDDELIEYGVADADGLYECNRGLYGTKIASHDKGARVRHFTRAYGYHLPDLDTDFIDEIAGNFAKLANQLPIEMVYFDGSELLQRPSDGSEHWYYNARLHKAFYDALDNKNILFQGSSCSPYSWHMISRNASADGHDDLKAYLEERSGGFDPNHVQSSYLDVGWYYAYDKNATPDMYEYCLGATIGYDASFSFQTSVSAAIAHPFIGEILDMIREYEDLRLLGRIPVELRPKFEIDRRLAGRKTVSERNALMELRKEYRLEKNAEGRQAFRKVVYPVWQNVYAGKSDLGGTTSSDAREENGAFVWELKVDAPCRAGLQVQFKDEGETLEGMKLVQPTVSFAKVDGKSEAGLISIDCELTKGQFAFALPGQTETVYGLPLNEPESLDVATPEIRLEPGVYRVTFSTESADIPIRVRTPLYTDELYPIPD